MRNGRAEAMVATDRPDAPEVVALMRLFANDLHMQAECCARIELLCEGSDRLAGLLISHGALEAIVKALKLCGGGLTLLAKECS